MPKGSQYYLHWCVKLRSSLDPMVSLHHKPINDVHSAACLVSEIASTISVSSWQPCPAFLLRADSPQVNHISQFRRLRPHAASIEPLMDIWLSKAQKAKGPTLSHTSVPGMVKPVVGVSRTDADHSTHPPSILASQGLHTASAPIRMPSNPHVGAVELEGISAPGAPSASRSRDTTPPVHSSTPKAPRSIHSSSASEHGTIIPESSARSHGIDPIGDLHSTYKNSSSPIKLPAMPASRSSQIQDALPTVSAAAFVSGPSSSGPSSSTSRLPPPLSGTSFNRDKAKRPRPASSHWLPRVPPSVIASSHDEMGSELLEATPTEGESGGMPAEIGSVPAEIAPVATIAAMSSSVSLGKRPRHADTPGPDVDETRGTDVKISTWATGMAKSTADRNTKYRGNLESRRQPVSQHTRAGAGSVL
ncbi:hypothetical protein BD324DRAFT_286413 [Kockovaella imperatae]|uniref:Uncharacterized protein n=1 Tax=Kockovaella imperatae TaxID=4999 RepID=A0A1Y1U5M8_9TREE|nr:hypothetical protein BD324DRAFT_286413 [Kockovaella imperatae]ORX33333.1 hypothetical protein BD324DRAFT_286413 [Kockovaella imperatae]